VRVTAPEVKLVALEPCSVPVASEIRMNNVSVIVPYCAVIPESRLDTFNLASLQVSCQKLKRESRKLSCVSTVAKLVIAKVLVFSVTGKEKGPQDKSPERVTRPVQLLA
jgi:hypothetical protein